MMLSSNAVGRGIVELPAKTTVLARVVWLGFADRFTSLLPRLHFTSTIFMPPWRQRAGCYAEVGITR